MPLLFRRLPQAYLLLGTLAAFPLLHAQAPGSSPPRPSAAPADPKIQQVLAGLGKVRSLYQTAISPDGKMLAWVVEGEKDGRGQGTEIEVAPLATPGQTIRATAGEHGQFCQESDLAWSPDSTTLAFLSDCQATADSNGQSDLYLYRPAMTGTARRLTHLHGIPESPAFSPDGRQIGFLYVEGATRRASPLAAEKPPAGVIGEEGLEIKRVAAADAATGAVRQITPASLYTYEFDWSPDSGELAYIAAPPPGENNWWVAKLYTESLPSVQRPGCLNTDCDFLPGKPRPIFDPANTPGPLHGLQIAVPRWSPDGKQIAFIGGLMSDQGATGGNMYVVPAGGAEPQLVAAAAPSISPTWITWIDSTHLGFSYVTGGSSGFSTVEPGTSVAAPVASFSLPASIGDGRLEMSLSIARTGDVVFLRSSFKEAPEVFLGRLGQSGLEDDLKPVTHYNDNLKPAWGKSESVTWTSAVQPSPTIPASSDPKNFNVQGWLLYPANYDPSKKYPLIVYVHGGPSSATLPRWPGVGFGPAPFAALGYFVLMPNPRGSYGQGEAFTAANRKDFGYGDLRDILAGVDAVTRSHNIDPERVGLTGWSYGGFMTMFAVTQTNRFRAAVAGAGISNWQSYYGENAIDQWMTPFMGASVYDDPGVYAKMSAVNFIHQVKTPTLAVVGDRDGECPAPQSFEFWHALKAQHVPTQLVVYPDEGHHFVNPAHQADVIARALAWFQQYMPAQP